jgi:Carboxypeptidase regulatory-like domain
MKRLTRKVHEAPAWVCSQKLALAVVAMVAILLGCLPVFSQTSTGIIAGGVYDQSGGAIVGATVTVTDVARGLSRTLTTTNSGQYVASNELPGAYTVKATAKGFQAQQQANIQVQVGETVRVDLKLQAGSQTQTVTVTSAAPQINTTNSTLGGAVSGNLISTLPVNGRNYVRLLALRAGSIQELGSGEGDGSQDAVSYNGLRLGDNIYVIEGIANINSFGASMLNQSNTSILSVDAISEYNLVSEGNAQYGWKGGANINIGIKSGTNALHGDAFALGRDGAWDAGDYFSGPAALTLENFGATVGGPILKDKLFFFVNYEGERIAVQDPTQYTIPSDIAMGSQDPTNQLSMVDACNFVGRANVNPLSALIAGLPAGSCIPQAATSTFENMFPFNNTSSNKYAPGLSGTTAVNSGFFKIDYQLNAKNRLDGMYFKSNSNVVGPSLETAWQLQTPTPVWFAAGHWTYVPNSSMVNELTVGGTLFTTTDIPGDVKKLASAPWPAGYGIPTGVTNPLYGGSPGISIAPFTGTLGNVKVGRRRGPEGNPFTAGDHLSYLRGNHSLIFGFDFLYMYAAGNTYAGSQGNINFTTLQNFLLGIPKNGQIFVGDATQKAHNTGYAIFGQDDWRIKPRLTLNLGLRWEYYTSPSDANNFIGNFYPNANPTTTPAIQQAGGPFPPLYHPQTSEFAPRLGFAWDINGNGKTVLRGGGGVYYNLPTEGDTIDTTPFGANWPSLGINNSGTAINIHTPERFTTPASELNWNTTGPVFPSAVPTVINGVTYTGVTCTPQKPCATVAVSPTMKVPYSVEWNIDIERALTSSLSLDVAYVGNHTYDMRSRNNINQPPFGYGWTNPSAALGGLSPAAYCIANPNLFSANNDPYLGGCLGNGMVASAVSANEVAGEVYPQYPYLNYITLQQNKWYSSYNGLQVTLSSRGYHGLDFIAGYTRSLAKDFMTFGGWAGPFSQDAYDVSHDYGPSDQQVPNRFTFSATYDIPGVRTPLQLLQGWQVSGIAVLQSGLPWYPQDQTSDLQGTGQINDPNSPSSQTWNYSGPTSAFTTTPTYIPCFSNPNGPLGGCTPYQADNNGNWVLPSACVSAATAPYKGNAQLQQLALVALTDLGCYVQGGGVLTPPAYGTFGNATRNLFQGHPYENLDLAVVKNFVIKERVTAQFRAEFYNALNRPEFITATSRTGNGQEGGAPDPEGGFGFGCACQSASGKNGVLGTGGPRSIQLGLKLIF